MGRSPPGGHLVGFAGIEADLHRRGAAHHPRTLRADQVEGGLHGLVAGNLQQPVRGTVRIGAAAAKHETGLIEKLGKCCRVRSGDTDQVGGRSGRWCRDLDLATGLDGDQAAGGQLALDMVGVDRRRCVWPKSPAQLACVQGAPGIAAVVDGPLELDPVQPRRSMLETDHGHVTLGLLTVAQRGRRLFGSG